MRRRIVAYLSILFAMFTAGAIISILYITFTTNQLKNIIMLHSVEILRQNLIIKIQNVEQDLLTVHTEIGKNLDMIVSNVTDLNNAINICAGCHHSQEITDKITNVRSLVAHFQETLSYYITASANEERIRALKMESYSIGTRLLEFTTEMATIANRKLQQRTQEVIRDIQRVQVILLITLVISFGCALWIAAALARRIIRPIRELTTFSRAIASTGPGHTTMFNDATEFGELARSMNDMSLSLRESNKRIVEQMKIHQETQEQLIQAEKLAAIGELASNVAHEINNPLTSILGYAELIREENDIEQIRKDMRIIESESMRARDIVNQLLEYARKRPIKLEQLNLNTVLHDVVSLLRIKTRDRNIFIEEDYGELPAINADPNQIKQVFLNLLNNSLDAIADGNDGRILIRTLADNGAVTVEITDNGQGISQETAHRIFEPFFTTKREKGTGLGLPVSYRIIQSHGGRMELLSSSAEGTTFLVTLPIEHAG